MTLTRTVGDAALLERGYRRCAELTRERGTTYFWGAALLAKGRRRHVHAIYALCRLADDIVDGDTDGVDGHVPGSVTPPPPEEAAQRLAAFADDFRTGLAAGTSADPVLAAVIDTVRVCGIDHECFDRFFGAMTMDLTTTSYETYADLLGYMEGSAAVIGEMMLPVLQPTDPAAYGPARALGLAFQLTNFLRDVDEDLDLGRVYIPQEDLRRFGVDPYEVRAARRRGDELPPAWRELMAFETERVRGLYAEADPGIGMLPPRSARCVSAARVLYAQILDRIEENGFDVFDGRLRVPTASKAATAGRILLAGPDGARGMPDIPIARVPQPREDHMRSTWRLARPARIAASLERAEGNDPGGWFVVGASTDVGADASITRTIAGRELVLWRADDGSLVAGPGACPHLGALLDRCPVIEGTLYCRWHGLSLTPQGEAGWSPFPAHDDGVLLWVRLPVDGETPLDEPRTVPRPPLDASVAAVIAKPGTCEPRDVIANRLDPWHGSWFHPYAFSHLVVDDDASDPDRLVVDVTFRLSRTWGVPVRAEFTCPDARTITMRITEGEGAGSVVETHATPLGHDRRGRPRTMVVEATVAHSERKGFAVARALGPLVRPAMRRTAAKLWVDDLAYAERRWLLRSRGEFPG